MSKSPKYVAKAVMPAPDVGRHQAVAGAVLLHRSKLVEWSRGHHKFLPVHPAAFEFSARHDTDPAFGRLMCWIIFSAGAEYLAKGLCILHQVPFAETKLIPDIPENDVEIETWLSATDGFPSRHGTTERTNFKEMGTLTYAVAGQQPVLAKLARGLDASPEDARLILGAYRLLGSSIRNRDAHAYIPNVRLAHFRLVEDLFLRAISLLVRWIPDGGGVRLQHWMDEAAENAAKQH